MTEMRTDLFSPPGNEAYRAATTLHNATVTQRPAMVAHPRNTEEVSEAVAWATRHDLTIVVQAGGHGAGAPVESAHRRRTDNSARCGRPGRHRTFRSAIDPDQRINPSRILSA